MTAITLQATIIEHGDTLSSAIFEIVPVFITRGEIVFVDLVGGTTTGSVPSASSGYGFTILFNIGNTSEPGALFTASLIAPHGEKKTIGYKHLRLGTDPIPAGFMPYQYVIYQAAPGDFDTRGLWRVAVISAPYFSRYADVKIDP